MRNKILKFRAWDGMNKKFTYWTMNDLCTYVEKDEKPNALDDWQQDTGLLDKNGKEIYEKDILQGVSGQIRYLPFKVELPNIYFIDENGHVPWEIIGNIYENPELLSIKE